ncbi:MAG: DUF3750 domain-containing protein [Burkholderiales bacterium]|nr:DUF3750 domain-containing protein [Burkholderiales bacterium]
MTRRARVAHCLAGVLLVAAVLAAAGYLRSTANWRMANRESVGLAPHPAATPEPVVQVYAARAIGWRGLFGVHTWIAVKPAAARAYTVYEVIGWRLRSSGSALVIRDRAPDARWFGAYPELVAERRGQGAGALIDRIDRLARAYPWAGEYSVWPGPNSNTFTAWVLRGAPELRADLPPTAIGKDYNGERLLAAAPSGSGLQFSVFGLLGVTASGVEGLEMNLLGLSFGVNPFDPALKLPIIGRLGPARTLGGR